MDLISREALNAVLQRYKFGAITNEAEREYTKDTVLDFVADQPTIEAVPVVHGWIPCSERLPECEDYAETDALLFQLQDGEIEVGYFGRKNAWRDAYFRHYRTPCGVDVSVVVAWMPLPEPYTEQT